MRYAITHRTTYLYDSPVDLADHVAYLRPRPFAGQTVLRCDLRVVPEPTRLMSHRDHFGNAVDVFRIETEHEALEVTMHAEIEVDLPAPPATPAWETVRDDLNVAFPAGVEAAEFVHPSPLVKSAPEALSYVRPSVTPGRPILDLALDVTRRIKRDFVYAPGSTDIATPLAEVFEGRRGVCQDFAHVQIASLRALGLPAAYVSGYIRTHRRAGAEDLRGADATHAWVAVWWGREAGWVHLDPTNDLMARDEHVVLAWGRDFADVSPLRGIILGGGEHSYSVAVEVKPLAATGA